MTDVIDIQTGKPVKPDLPKNATINQWFNGWKKYCKDYDVNTIAIIGVDAEGATFYDVIGVNEINLLRIYRDTNKLKDLIDAHLDPEDEEDMEEV